MSTVEIEQSALQLPVKERLRLARRLVESIGDPDVERARIEEGSVVLKILPAGRCAA